MKKGEDKIKVCIVVAILPPGYGGAEFAAIKYADRLNKSRYAEAIVIGWDRTDVYKQYPDMVDFVYPVSLAENPKDAKGIFIFLQEYYHMWNCFRQLIKPMWTLRKKYDFVHNFNSGFAFNRVSILIAKMLGKKVITETSLVGDDDPVSLGRIRNWKDYLKPKFTRYLFYRMADRYISKSCVITEIFERSSVPMKKVAEIPYSVDIKKFTPVNSEIKNEIRSRLGLWKEGTFILFVGGINLRKRVHLLLEAFTLLEKKYSGLRLLIVGPTYKYDKKYVNNLKEKINKERLFGKVKLIEDNVKNVNEYMQCSDIFVLPSNKEGFPISIIEAMSSGMIVIGSDIPEIAKAQIINGKDGYLFKTGDSVDLSRVIETALCDKDKMQNICREARIKVEKNWSDEIVDKAYKNLYESMTLLKNKEPVKRKRIKILYTIPNFNSAGSGKALINIISRLDKNIFEPNICCRHEKGDLFSSAKKLNIPIYISEFSTPMKPRVKGIENVLKLTGFFKKISPDIIHSYNYSDDYSEALAAKLSGIKWVYTKKNMSWGSNAWKIRTKLADAIIPQNHEMLNSFFQNTDKYSLIPMGIDLKEFSDLKKDEELEKKYNLGSSYPVILTIANVIPIKGIDYLIKGFNLILEDFENAKLIIAGEDKTEYAEELKKNVRELNIEDKVIFTGKQNNIKPFFSIADIFILSSKKGGEGGPISVLEAMASGILSFGSDVPGIRDQFREFEDQLFESENPGSIANKILKAVNMSDQEINQRVLKQKEFIRKYYSLEKEVALLEEFYLKVYKN